MDTRQTLPSPRALAALACAVPLTLAACGPRSQPAGIFLGDIAKWNDPKLVADNPDLATIDQDIVVVHRSDGSARPSAGPTI